MSFILVVDDEPIVREPIAAILRGAGHEVECAASGPEALSKLQTRVPALMLMDISMPGLDGLQVLQAVRGMNATEHLPVIFLTGAVDRKSILRAGRLGVNTYLLKSAFSTTELLIRVGVLLAGGPA